MRQTETQTMSRDEVGHPSQDATGRCPLDQLLRRYGYAIHARLPEDEVAKARGT